jgi:alpha-beta hydrolase superfamily lysophospholipase
VKSDKIVLAMSDSTEIVLHRWIPDGEVRGTVQICHGMVEYALRYGHFAEALVKAGFAVYAHDLRGHGETAKDREDLGYLADSDGFQRVVLDLRECITRLKSDFPGKKVILFGHSFGSFISQSFIEQFGGEINACILSGTSGPMGGLVDIGRIIANLIMLCTGKRHRSKLLHILAFGSYNKRIQKTATSVDWISRDPVEVKKYYEDPYCRFLPTASFFHDLFTGLCRIHKKAALASIPKTLPLLLVAGTEDPVGAYGKTVTALDGIYRTLGIQDITLKLYPGGRHEMLSEVNKDQVIIYLVAWITKYVN